MLESILIRNFAIIDSLQLELDAGLSALTGETGAGNRRAGTDPGFDPTDPGSAITCHPHGRTAVR